MRSRRSPLAAAAAAAVDSLPPPSGWRNSRPGVSRGGRRALSPDRESPSAKATEMISRRSRVRNATSRAGKSCARVTDRTLGGREFISSDDSDEIRASCRGYRRTIDDYTGNKAKRSVVKMRTREEDDWWSRVCATRWWLTGRVSAKGNRTSGSHGSISAKLRFPPEAKLSALGRVMRT